MKKTILAVPVLLACAVAALSQAPFRIYTSPKLPARDALERMNLVQAWHARVKVDGNRDGVFSVQVLPGKTNQLLVQTLQGAVYLFEADNGDLIWSNTTVGEKYWEPQPAAYNSQSIFVTRRNVLHVLNRFTGAQRVFTFDERSKLPDFGYTLTASPNAGLVADEDFLYVPMGDKLHAIYIPDFAAIDRARKTMELRKEGKAPLDDKRNLVDEDRVPTGPDSAQPVFFFAYKFTNEIMTSPALIYGEQVSMLTTDGTLTSINRFEKGPRVELFEYQVYGKALGAAGQYNNIAYFGSNDFNLYAINMNGGKLIWRYLSGAPLVRKPEVNDNDVFISPEQVGLRRLDRRSGKELWTNRDTVRFVAANNTNVYALDKVGKFYVLDGRRGTTLATYNLSDWTIAVANEWTDRIYFAANDGQILCLRHRDLARPLVMKSEEAPKKEEKIEKKKEPEKKEEKKDEEKKDKDAARAPLRLFGDGFAHKSEIRSTKSETNRRHEAQMLALDERLSWAGR